MRACAKLWSAARRWQWGLLVSIFPFWGYAQSQLDIVWMLGSVYSPRAISANGEMLVEGSPAYLLKIWYLPENRLIRTLGRRDLWGAGQEIRNIWATGAAVSPDGTRMALTVDVEDIFYESFAVFVLADPWTGSIIRRFEFDDATSGPPAFSPDGQRVAVPVSARYASRHRLLIVRASDGQVEQEINAPFSIRALRYLPDGRLLAAGMLAAGMQDSYPWIWEVFSDTRWRIEHRWNPNYLPSLHLAPNGQYLFAYISESYRSRTVYALYDVFSGQRIRSETIPFDMQAAQFSYDSQFLLLAMERYESGRWISSLQVRQLPGWQLLRQLEGVSGAMLSHPSRPELFLGNRIWNWLTGEWVGEVGHIAGADKSPLFSPDGRFLVVAGWNEISVWRLQDRALHYRLRFAREWVNQCLISPDGTLLAVELRNWDSRIEQVALYHLEDGSLHRHLFTGDRYADTLRFSPDVSLLAVDLGSQVHLYRTVDGTLQSVIADSGVPLVFSSDGRYLVTRTHVWQLPGLVPVFTFEWTEWVQDEPNHT